jgi:hypothetical protein
LAGFHIPIGRPPRLAFPRERAYAGVSPKRRNVACPCAFCSAGPVNAYNSNGLWLQSPESAAAEALERLDERAEDSEP